MSSTTIPIITIDGPSSSGKGTVAKLVATKLGFHYLDSGALYRIVALATQQANIAWDNATEVAACAKALHIRFIEDKVYLNNIDVSDAIRSEQMGKGASEVAVHASLRSVLLDLQQSFQQPPGLVADGRDMGSVVFKKAQLKIFLTASAETRAKRRCQQLLDKGQNADFTKILLDLQQRDARDQGRASAPLIIPADALLLETDNLSISAAVNFILVNYWHKMYE